MASNPFLGVFFHWIGGLAAASFYIPYRQAKRWSWETYWLVGGVFSWIVMPWLMAYLLAPDFFSILKGTPVSVLLLTYAFGALWGVGGLTFGLTMRYMGIALGYAVALGYTTVFGTLVPPLFHGELGGIAGSVSGRYTLLGVLISVGGIAISGMAGMSKERELTDEQKRSSITEFHFAKGMAIATFSGVMSACMAFGLDAGKPIAASEKALLSRLGGTDLWQGLPILVVVLLGGFTTNFIWCVLLNVRNRSVGEYAGIASSGDGADSSVVRMDAKSLSFNYLFSACAGILWYLQFFFYSMGQTKMGTYGFSSWSIHMASIMIFSMLWGVALKEWKGTSQRTHRLIGLGLAALIVSTLVMGYGNFLKAASGG